MYIQYKGSTYVAIGTVGRFKPVHKGHSHT